MKKLDERSRAGEREREGKRGRRGERQRGRGSERERGREGGRKGPGWKRLDHFTIVVPFLKGIPSLSHFRALLIGGVTWRGKRPGLMGGFARG